MIGYYFSRLKSQKKSYSRFYLPSQSFDTWRQLTSICRRSCARLPGLSRSFALNEMLPLVSIGVLIRKLFFDLPADELFRSRANSLLALLIRSFSSCKIRTEITVRFPSSLRYNLRHLFALAFFSSTLPLGGEVLGGGGSLSVQFSGCESESARFELSSLTRSSVRSTNEKRKQKPH